MKLDGGVTCSVPSIFFGESSTAVDGKEGLPIGESCEKAHNRNGTADLIPSSKETTSNHSGPSNRAFPR
jgi:hypothetical protein